MGDTITTNHKNAFTKFIDKEMIPAKLTYLLCEGYMGSILPILNVFFVMLGLTPAQAGLITGVSFAVAAIAPPIWSSIIEAFGYRRTNFIILCIGVAATVFSMPYIAISVAEYKFNMTCAPKNMSRHHMPPGPLLHFQKPPKGVVCHMQRFLLNSDMLFTLLLIMNIVSRIFFVTLTSYVDSVVVKVVKTRQRPTTYGVQRVFGVIGFGMANFVAGLAVEHYHPRTQPPFIAAFYVFLPCIILLMPVGYILLGQLPNEPTNHDDNNNNVANFSSLMISFLKKLDTIVLLLTITVSGTALNMMFNFLFLFMLKDLHSTKMNVTCVFLTCMLTQLVAFPASGRIIRRVGSPILFIIVGVFSYFPRFIMMSYIENPLLAIPISLIEPIGLALNWAAQIELTYQLAPKEISLTAINIINTIHFVASSAIANIVGGIVYNKYGGRVLYRGMGIVCGVWSVVIALFYGWRYLKQRKIITKEVTHAYVNEGESVA